MESATPAENDTATAARRYFDALGARDLDAAAACWAPDGRDHMIGVAELAGPGGVRGFFSEMFDAFPDLHIEVVDQLTEGDRSAVRWRATATFAGPGSWQGIAPTGARIDLRGCDVCTVRDGKLVANFAYTDSMSIARQLGMMPPQGSTGERRMLGAFNAKTRVARTMAAGDPEPIADGVWLLRGGFPGKTMNVYLIEDDGGVTVFDAGVRSMSQAVVSAGARMGGVRRVVLGHAHEDHRGTAPALAELGAAVLCHEADRADAEGDGGRHYFDMAKLNRVGRLLMPRLLSSWDAGPVPIAGTVAEDDEIAGFRVVHLPGHAPGLIGLFRESDRLALVSDCFYTLDPQTGRKGPPRMPHAAFNFDTEQARASIRKLAALEPAAAWPGHADGLTGDVRAQLERAADTT